MPMKKRCASSSHEPPAIRPAVGEAVSHSDKPFLNETREAKNSAHPKAMRLRSEGAPVKQIDGAGRPVHALRITQGMNPSLEFCHEERRRSP